MQPHLPNIDIQHRQAVTAIHGIVAAGPGLQAVGLGLYALASTSTNSAVAMGYGAGQNNTTGALTAVGHLAGRYNTTGSLTAVGYLAGQANTTGALTAVGAHAGRYAGTGTTPNETSTGGIYLGQDTRASADGVTNETVVGHAAIGGGSNTVTLGGTGVTHWLPGATNTCSIGRADRAFQDLYLHDGTDEWRVTIDSSGALNTAKV